MKKIIVITVLATAFTFQLKAQSNSIASSLGLYVFPAKGQTAQTQDTDEADCYNWAKQQTGIDPSNPTVAVAAPANTSPNGTAVKSSAGGAAAGAAIGAIAGDAGEGAAIGAVVGGLAGIRRRRQQEAQQTQQNQAAAQQYNATQKADFNKAFTACMQGKGYTVQ